MKQLLSILLLGLSATLAVQPASAADTKFLTIGTASAGGGFYPLGVAMAEVYNQEIEGVKAIAQETKGSVANMFLLRDDKAQLGMSTELFGIMAVKGKGPFDGKPIKEIVAGWAQQSGPAILLALKDSGLKTIEDLKGKRISLGTPGSAAVIVIEQLLASHGMEKGKDYSPSYMGFEEAADAIADGAIDAAAMLGALPQAATVSLASRHPIEILHIDPAKAKQGDIPLIVVPVPAGTYEGQNADANMVELRNTLFLRRDLPEDLAYELVKATMENKAKLGKASAAGRGLALLPQDQVEALGLEVHPGVIKYAKEVGAWQ